MIEKSWDGVIVGAEFRDGICIDPGTRYSFEEYRNLFGDGAFFKNVTVEMSPIEAAFRAGYAAASQYKEEYQEECLEHELAAFLAAASST